MPARSIDNAAPVIKRLRALAKESPELEDAARFYEAVLPLLCDANLHAGPVPLVSEQAREKMANGIPLLHGLDLEVDVEAARDLMISLARAVERAGVPKRGVGPLWFRSTGERTASALRIRTALEENLLDLPALLAHITAGENESVTSEAQRHGLDPGLVRALAQNALKPAFRSWCRQLSSFVTDIEWNRESCFLCGAQAVLAEFQKNDQEKHLRCGTCGADWRVRRMQCVRCGNEDHATMRCLFIDDQRARMHAEACDVCRGYIKVVAAFAPTPVENLAIEDLATLHLDHIVQERGYTRTLPDR